MGDLRLLEDGCERGGALESDVIVPETARDGCRSRRVSTGVDTKANTREPVRAPGGLLERLQCRVALDALGESGSSFGTEPVALQTASTGAEAGVEYSSVNGR